MSRTSQTAGSRTVSVPPERLARWLAGFVGRHGEATAVGGSEHVVFTAADGATANCRVPFPPLPGDASSEADLIAHVSQDRRVGVLLVRRGGYAAGVFEGTTLVVSKVGSRHVQGRTAAGGWSQQRFARRRDNQAKELCDAAAEVAVRLLVPEAPALAGVVLGGDDSLLREVLGHRLLAPLQSLMLATRVEVPDPKKAVLDATPQAFRSVRITVTDPVG